MATQSVKIIGLDSVVKTLRELGPAAQKNGGPIRSALRKAALVMQAQVKANLRAIVQEPNQDGLPSKSTGLLEQNVVVTRGKAPRGQNGERVIVRIRRKAYPPTRGKNASTPQIARLLEYGSELVKPHPFLRPAFETKKHEALEIFSRELPRAILTLQKKIARANGNP